MGGIWRPNASYSEGEARPGSGYRRRQQPETQPPFRITNHRFENSRGGSPYHDGPGQEKRNTDRRAGLGKGIGHSARTHQPQEKQGYRSVEKNH